MVWARMNKAEKHDVINSAKLLKRFRRVGVYCLVDKTTLLFLLLGLIMLFCA